jgi:glycosyltransferase involved in cell wall biosynthesis
MKILYDHQTFTIQNYGGISRYFSELLRQGKITNDNELNLSLLYTNNENLTFDNNYTYKKFLPNMNFKGKARLQNLLNENHTKHNIKKNNFNIFHPTYYDTYFLNELKGRPFAITFLDMIHEKFSSDFNQLKYDVIKNKKKIIENTTRFVAISETTKNDMAEIYGINKDRIDVIYLANPLSGIFNEIQRITPKRYILFVGGRSGYKNFDFCLESISIILKQNDINLVCAGGGNFTEDEIILISKLNLNNHVIQKEINQNILYNLYTNAEAFIFPSLYEGFGLPILEAFSCGTACLLSNGGSLPEIGSDAAVYFDPNNSDSIKNAVFEVLDNSDKRIEIIEKGFIRLFDFSWEKTYEKTITYYKTLM